MAMDVSDTVETQKDIMDTGRNWVRVLSAMILAAVLMAVFNSEALLGWVRGLPVGGIEEKIIAGVEVWHGWMTSYGAGDFIAMVREQVRLAKDTTW